MKSIWFASLLVLIFYCPFIYGSAVDKTPSTTGTVVSVSDGTLSINGIAHSIAKVNTKGGMLRIAVPTMGVMQALKAGETLTFSGPLITVGSEKVVDTQHGFILRTAEKSMAEEMAEKMKQAMALSKSRAA